MQIKIHIDFFVNYNNINIFLIWILNQRKVIRIRNVTFNKNTRYCSNKIDLTQLVIEFFLTNNMLNIFYSDFAKIINIESNNEKKL